MASLPKVVARRRDTSPGSTPHTPSRLPEDVLAAQLDRLAVLAMVAAGLWLIGVGMNLFLTPSATGQPLNVPAVLLNVGGVVTAAVMFWYVKWCPTPTQRKPIFAVVFLIANAAAIAILNAWIVPRSLAGEMQLSWTTLAILIFAMISPTPPRAMLYSALVAASMDPLAYLASYLMGSPVVSVAQGLLDTIPSYCCAAIAILPSRRLYRLGHELSRARELGNYQLVERLGIGGMGEVWRANHRLLVRNAAVKLVRPELLGAHGSAEVQTTLARFEREAQATATLGSPHSIQVFDFGITDDGTFYYVMELLTGRDVESLVREFGPVPAQRAIALLRQVCHSLADAHARGLVHRDVKPANIYVCRMGLEYDFVKVLDFGLVKVRSATGVNTTLAGEQSTTGTPAYIAPEIALGDREVDRRADVYAIGCVAYYMLTGQLVFEADTPMKMLMKHVQDVPTPPSQRTELPIPAALDELILACLEKDPDKRPQNAEELFEMACACPCAEGWDQAAARRWWEAHLPELTGPLSMTADDLSVRGRALARPAGKA